MSLDAMILVFFMVSLKSVFSCSSFTFIKRLFSCSSLSAIRVVSSAYLRLLILLPAILTPPYASSSPAFLMVYSAYKLNKQSANIQPWCTPFPIWNSSISCSIASWPTYRLLSRQVRLSGIPISKNFPVCCDSHSQRLWCSQWNRSRCLSGILLLFLWLNRHW